MLRRRRPPRRFPGTPPTTTPSADPRPLPTGRLTGDTIGQTTLGMTRVQASEPYTLASAQGRRNWDFFSLAGGKVRVAYPSSTLLRALPSGERDTIRGRVILALTANPYYSLDGVRPGVKLSAAKAA